MYDTSVAVMKQAEKDFDTALYVLYCNLVRNEDLRWRLAFCIETRSFFSWLLKKCCE